MTTQMTYEEYMGYASQIGTLEHLLETLPEDRTIERMGFESRLRRIENRLRGVPVPPQPKKLAVSFNGRPVDGNRGIDANFGAEAVTMFSDTVRITSAGMSGDLKATGQVPRSALSQPSITGVTFGSFGFVMEMPTPQSRSDRISYPELAVGRVQELLRLANDGDDNELSVAAAEMHPRALNKVVDLLDFMRRKGARFEMDYQDRSVQFRTDNEIIEAGKRLSPSNIENRTADVVGIMIGVIPATRLFQLNPSDRDPIHGRIGTEIRDPYSTGEEYTNKLVRAEIRTVRVGRGAPRYTLLSVAQLQNPEDV